MPSEDEATTPQELFDTKLNFVAEEDELVNMLLARVEAQGEPAKDLQRDRKGVRLSDFACRLVKPLHIR